MKIDIKRALLVASAATERAWSEMEPTLTDEESNGACALFKSTIEHIQQSFDDLEEFKVIKRKIGFVDRWIIRDTKNGKDWCRKGSTKAVRYSSVKTAQVMADRLNQSRLRNG